MAGVVVFRVARQTFRFMQCGRRILVSSLQVQGNHSQKLCTSTSSLPSGKPLKITGLSRQYSLIKQKFPNYIVLFQVGDFYEIYNEDARKVAEKTQLRLTKNSNMNSLMAGFPARALESWQTTLVQQGFQLAVCAQFPEKTPKSSRLLHREVVRLVTPGTLLEPLQPDANYLLSVIRGQGSSVGLAWLDLSTGEFRLSVSNLDSFAEDLARINPAEILVCEENLKEKHRQPSYKISNQRESSPLACLRGYHLTVIPSDWFHLDPSEHHPCHISDYFKALSSTEFASIEVSAATGLLQFVSYTQRDVAPLINSPSQFSKRTHMAIDPNTRQALELTKPLLGNDKKATLFGVLDATATSAGKRLLHSRICAPSTVVNIVSKRLNAVEFFCENSNVAESLQKTLKYCPDIERKLQKIATGLAGLSDLRSIRNSLILYQKVLHLLSASFLDTCYKVEAVSILLMKDFESLQGLHDELDRSVGELTSEYSMMEGYSDNADDVQRKIVENGQKVQELKETYKSTLQIRGLTINANKAFIRVIEVPVAQESKLAANEDFVRVDGTAEKIRYSTLRLQELNAELKALQEERDRIQKALSTDLCQQVASYDVTLKQMAMSLAELDVASSLALLAINRGFVKPKIVDGTEFEVKGGRHPVVDIMQPDSFVNNDCILTEKNLWVVTGPNMGGKSTFLRQNALLAIMAQAGSFIPAQSATIGVVDRVFARIGASDNLVQHQSTFMSEMLETAYILSHATQNSLVVIDEIGRGTSTFDGLSIAWAVIEHLHTVIRCRTLTSTHFHYLATMSHQLPHVHSCHVTARSTGQGISFTFKVMPGCDERSFGIDVAKLAGIPPSVEQRARTILSRLEDNEAVFSGSKIVSPESHSQSEKINDEPCSVSAERDNLVELNLKLKQDLLHPLVSLDPNALTPKQALEIVYNLHAKAKASGGDSWER